MWRLYLFVSLVCIWLCDMVIGSFCLISMYVVCDLAIRSFCLVNMYVVV